MMEAMLASKTSALRKARWYHIPKGGILHIIAVETSNLT
jgi:hypothetical protein